MNNSKFSGWDRRGFFQAAQPAVGLAATAPRVTSAAQRSETEAVVTPRRQPPKPISRPPIFWSTLTDWGATPVFGIVGDGINSIIESLRKRQDRIRYIAVRHEGMRCRWLWSNWPISYAWL
jgi:pyruvate dehydrogenase (quinone)